MRRISALSCLFPLAASLLFAGTAQAAPAAPVDYVALGDSYVSGVGAGDYDPASGLCFRSRVAYPVLWTKANPTASFAFPACGGATTDGVVNNQLGSVRATTDLVTISIGGNDSGFFGVMSSCTLGGDQACVDRVKAAEQTARAELPAKLDRTYAAIKSKAPAAKLVVLGYPRLFEPRSCSGGLTEAKRTAINHAADALAEVIQQRAAAAKATYVDVRKTFAGHGVCGSQPWLNALTFPPGNSYHPNASGHSKGYLAALQSVTG